MSIRTRLLLSLTVLTCLALPVAPALAQADRDCPDFASQEEAQAVFDADPSDPNRLDRDDDGIACEEPGDSGDGSGPSEPETVQAPSRIDTGGGGTADRDGADRTVLAGGIALAGLAALAAVTHRRRARG